MTVLRSPTRALRRAWPIYLAGLLGLFLASLPHRYVELRDLTISGSLPADVLRFLDTAAVDAALQQLNVPRPTYAAWMLVLEIAFAAVWVAMSVVIFRRHSRPLTGLIAGFILATFGVGALPTLEALAVAAPAWHLPTALVNVAAWSSLLAFLFLFPDGRFVPRPAWVIVAAFALWEVAFTLWPAAAFSPFTWPTAVALAVWVLFFAAGAAAQFYRYLRRSDEAARRQSRWVVFAIAGAVVLISAINVPNQIAALGAAAAARPVYELFRLPLSLLAAMGLPVAIAIAILRHRLWDIDLIVNRTLVYVPLTAVLAGVYTASIRLFQGVFVALTGNRSDAAIVMTTLVVAAAATPARNALQVWVDRHFREPFDPARSLRNFNRRLDVALEVLDPLQLAERLLRYAVAAHGASGGAVVLDRQGQLFTAAATSGWRGVPHVQIPLEWQGTQVGLLLLGPPEPGALRAQDFEQVLEDCAARVARLVALIRHGG